MTGSPLECNQPALEASHSPTQYTHHPGTSKSGAANAPFIRGFIAAVVPPAERGHVIDATGNLSQTGLRRLRNALFVHAYGTSPESLNALARLTESIDASDLNLARALLTMAPRFADQNARIAAGALHPLSITENLAQALQKLADLRARGESVQNWLAQDRIPGIGDDPGPVTTTLVQSLHSLRQKPRQLLDTLDRYAKAVESAGDPRQMAMFGEVKPTRETLWKLAVEWKQPTLAMGSKRVAPSAAEQEFKAQRQRQILKTAASAYSKILQRQWGLITTEEFTAVWNHKPSPFEGGEDATKWLKLNYFSRYIIPAYLGKSWSTEALITPETMHLAVETARQQPDAAAQRGNAELSRLQSNGKLVKGQDGFWNETPLEWLNSQSASLPVSSSQSLPPKTALKLYHTLSAKPERTVPQQQALERAERSLGQLFLFDTPNPSLQPAADLILEQQTASRATFADSSPQQLKLFMANKAPLPAPETPEETAALDAMFESAARVKPQLDSLLQTLAAQFSGKAVTSPLKGRPRALQKARVDYQGDFSKLKDLARATLECSTMAQAKAAAAEITRRHGPPKRNLFDADPIDGYRDALYHFPIDGTVVELQIHIPEVQSVKKQLHGAYVRREEIKRAAAEQSRPLTTEEQTRIDRLNRGMRHFYNYALNFYSVHDTSATSSSTSSGFTRNPPRLLISSSVIGRGVSPSNAQPVPVRSTITPKAPSGLASSGTSIKSLAPGNSEGFITPESTPISPANQPVRITTHNISQYAGTVDVTALQGRQKDWRQAFDWQPGVPVVPLAKLVSPKNELEDPKFKAGLKKDPRQNAADWLLKAINGVAGAKKRAPLDVSANPDGTYTIHDGNATAQALMLAGWKAVPVNIVPAPTLAMSRKAPNGQPSNLTEAQWHQVRTPQFKAWFGDWETLAEDAAWRQRVANYYANPNQRQMLMVGRVPAVLRAAGVSDAPLMMPPSVIGKATGGKHTLTREIVEQVPAALRNPVFVFDSATETGAVTVLTEIKHNGRNVLAAIHLDQPAPNKPANLILSLYDKGAPAVQQWIKGGLLRYAHQKKARAYFLSARLQLPREGSKAGNPNLLTEAEVVNDAVNPDSVSKVVDENGEPMVVYHGTPTGGFDTFNKNASGIWFSASKNYASQYASGQIRGNPGTGEVYSVFLNIARPVDADAFEKNDPIYDDIGLGPEIWQDNGFDGVFSRSDGSEKSITYRAFNPTQIKSATANSGAFDGTNPSILAKATTAPPRLGRLEVQALPGTATLHAANATLVGPALFKAITAYHGTPHEVDKFSLEKIGSGEGAQVYGWGLYFATLKSVAESYQKVLSGKNDPTRFAGTERDA